MRNWTSLLLQALLLVQLAAALWYMAMVGAWIGVAALLGRLTAIPIISVIGV